MSKEGSRDCPGRIYIYSIDESSDTISFFITNFILYQIPQTFHMTNWAALQYIFRSYDMDECELGRFIIDSMHNLSLLIE